MKAIVTIPVYKSQPSESDRISLRQCIQVLGKHPICLFGPEGLDLSAYNLEFDAFGKTYRYEAFDKQFFQSQRGYNHLMLTRSFYERFQEWDYMLIYQLDAFVFSDQLEEWCAKGYDYVGAPFLKLSREVDWQNAGNGGFSLRRVASFLQVFNLQGKVLSFKGLWRYYRYRGPLHRLPLCLKGWLGSGNHLEDFMQWETHNEDLFYAVLHDSSLRWNIPDSKEAMFFAFEGQPSTLYKHTGKLPFGCHAYLNNEFDSFYSSFIPHSL